MDRPGLSIPAVLPADETGLDVDSKAQAEQSRCVAALVVFVNNSAVKASTCPRESPLGGQLTQTLEGRALRLPAPSLRGRDRAKPDANTREPTQMTTLDRAGRPG